MSKVQTTRAPDLLTIEEVLPQAPPPDLTEGAPPAPSVPDVDRTGPRTYCARIGSVVVPVEKVGRRAGDPVDRVTISVADLKRIAKEPYRLGWKAHCLYVGELFDGMTRDIGE